ncbi:MAG TPA: hypothetical protein VFJ11_01825, partial [Gaiellaceae bacterium]|nr:hypothetical protein [Gaiellaceae bacterium]
GAAAESARRAAEQEAARRAAEDARLMLAPAADPPAATEVAVSDEREQPVDLPIYRWFGDS